MRWLTDCLWSPKHFFHLAIKHGHGYVIVHDKASFQKPTGYLPGLRAWLHWWRIPNPYLKKCQSLINIHNWSVFRWISRETKGLRITLSNQALGDSGAHNTVRNSLGWFFQPGVGDGWMVSVLVKLDQSLRTLMVFVDFLVIVEVFMTLRWCLADVFVSYAADGELGSGMFEHGEWRHRVLNLNLPGCVLCFIWCLHMLAQRWVLAHCGSFNIFKA